MGSYQPGLNEKLAFFKVFESHTLGDDDFDAREVLDRQRRRKFFHAQTQAQPSLTASTHDSRLIKDGKESREVPLKPRRVSSAPSPRRAAQIIKGTPVGAGPPKGRLRDLLNDNDSSVIKETPPSDARHIGRKLLDQGDSTPLNPAARRLLRTASDQSPSAAPGLRKRKREPGPKLRPEQEQIFKGLSFFYVPNNDVAPARRIRITKAREYGVVWTTNVSEATHVIVDNNLGWKDVEGILNKTSTQHAPTVVNEDYPIDCIQFRAVLDYKQKKYRLNGQPCIDQEDAVVIPVSSSESAQSLQLKPPPKNRSRWDYVPSRSKESTPRSSEPQAAAEVDSQPIVIDLGSVMETTNHEEPNASFKAAGGRGDQVAGGRGATTSMDNEARKTEMVVREDELSECITTMQEFKDLPLDAEDEDDSRSTAKMPDPPSDSDDGSRSQKPSRPRKSSRLSRKATTFEDRFACNQAGAKDANAANPNARTIEVLQSMANYYERVNDHWRTTAYRKAISTLKRQDSKISTEEEAYQLPNIGSRLAQKIEEIVTTDRLRRLEYAKAEPMDGTLQLFLGIYGVGVSQAQQWIAQGFRTLDDLKDKANLTTNQRLGVEHYDDLNTRIPRSEVEALGDVVKTAAGRIDPLVEMIIGGSYRRGSESSHDIDLIVTKPDTESSSELRGFLDKLVQQLEKEGFLVARLASSRTAGDGSKWHGCCVLPQQASPSSRRGPIWRRIDFLLVPESEKGAALIYFTGNDIFNRSMRLLASKKKMRLNQRGLYKDPLRGPERTKGTEGELIEGRDERRIFEILGVKWREPHERWC